MKGRCDKMLPSLQPLGCCLINGCEATTPTFALPAQNHGADIFFPLQVIFPFFDGKPPSPLFLETDQDAGTATSRPRVEESRTA